MINWKVRIKNKTFWLTLIPALIIFIEVVASSFGFSIQIENFNQNIVTVVNALFTLLAILGIVVDPTTKGVSDSTQALSYEKPKGDDENE